MKAGSSKTERRPSRAGRGKGKPPAAAKTLVVPLFNELERDLLRPRPPVRPSQWAEANRWLYESAVPGPWRNSNAPYLAGIMDIPTRPGCIELNLKKASRVGASEASRNVIGYWGDYEPDPVGLTLPDRSTGRHVTSREVLPMFRRTRCLRRLLGPRSRDAQTETITLANGFHLDLMWAGSATSTAARTYRRVVNDEVDKMLVWAGKEADPIGRTTSRTRTYGFRRLVWNQSTPTTNLGAIHRLFEASTVKLHYFVPCPHCGHYQRLTFPQLRWEKFEGDDAPPGKAALADRIVREKACWYQCVSCDGRITGEQKPAMMRAGRWSTEEGRVIDADGVEHADAAEVAEWPRGTRIGMHISQLYCLWIEWEDIAAAWLRADGDIVAMYNFRTEVLGEIWEFRVQRVERSVFARKVEGATLPAGVVPDWAWLLLAGVDTQMDHLYVVIRAFGHGMRSQRVWHQRVYDWASLDRLLFVQKFPVANNAWDPMGVRLALIDSGGTEGFWLEASRTRQVYDYAVARQPRGGPGVWAIRGASRPTGQLYWPAKSPSPTVADRRKIPDGLRLWIVDSHACNDLLADWISTGAPGGEGDDAPPVEERWLLNRQDDPEYDAHLAGMWKVPDPVDRRSAAMPTGRWRAIHSGGRVDYRMCEAYLVAAAYMAEVHRLPPAADLAAQREAIRSARAERGDTATAAPPPTGDDWTPRPL